MSQPVVGKLDSQKKIWLGLATVVVIAALFLFGVASGTGQSAAPQSADAAKEIFSFEVASIKPEKSGPAVWGVRPTPDGLSARGTLQRLIRIVYRIEPNQISGAPGWVSSEKYVIEAKMDQGTADKMKKLDDAQKTSARYRMLQTLLADRFKLTTHRETKELPIYSLVVAKGGSKLHETKSGEVVKLPDRRSEPPGSSLISLRSGELTGQNLKMDQIARLLTEQTGRTVVDNTGLKGNYDFTLNWTPDLTAPAPDALASGGPDTSTSSEPGPSIFTAIQEQLGLKLESQKGPVEILVIDHVERPSEN